jgi:hypothetical protein
MLVLLVGRSGALTRPRRGCGLLATPFEDDTFLIRRIRSAFPDRWLNPQWRYTLVIIMIRRRERTKKDTNEKKKTKKNRNNKENKNQNQKKTTKTKKSINNKKKKFWRHLDCHSLIQTLLHRQLVRDSVVFLNAGPITRRSVRRIMT